jgi:hypothetical protein
VDQSLGSWTAAVRKFVWKPFYIYFFLEERSCQWSCMSFFLIPVPAEKPRQVFRNIPYGSCRSSAHWGLATGAYSMFEECFWWSMCLRQVHRFFSDTHPYHLGGVSANLWLPLSSVMIFLARHFLEQNEQKLVVTKRCKKWKLLVYNSVIVSRVLYGLEPLEPTETIGRMLDAFQLKGLRKILNLHTTRCLRGPFGRPTSKN